MPASRRVLLAGAAALALAACSGGDDVTADRERQVREAAEAAGLADDVVDVLVLAAKGTTATYQVSYAGTGGASIVVSQDPPNRRVDVLTAGLVVESRVVRGDVAYRCTLPAGAAPGSPLDCDRSQGALPEPGAFSDSALDVFLDELLGSVERFDLAVDVRTVADVEARCLIAAPRAGTPLDGTGPGVDTVCMSPEGAQLVVDVGGERAVADAYSTTVPTGTFDI